MSTRRRQKAGLILGDISWQPDNLDEFVVMEQEPFLYEESKKSRTLAYRYWIAKYPVTNSQYARFVEEVGKEPSYWTNRDFNNPLSPVVGVSWHDARAYCNWLNGKFKDEGFRVAGVEKPVSLQKDYVVRLPTEEEWERAARGTDGREYPWGTEFDASRANTEESDTEKKYGVYTTAVYAYPLGVSPVGAWDMAGNVWEWTASKEGEYRVLRGGSWVAGARAARCTSRYWGLPYLDIILGFRVVLSLADSDF